MSAVKRCSPLLIGLVVAACGTTVPFDQQATHGAADPGGSMADPLGAQPGGSGPVGGIGAGNPGSSTNAPGSPTSPDVGSAQDTAGTPTTVASAPGNPRAAATPGMTATTIRVGVYRDRAEGANAAALGFGGIGEANTVSKEEVVVADLNRRGGVLGRQVEVVYHDYEQDSGKPLAQRDQEACTTWTQDKRVFMVLSAGFTDVLSGCLSKAGIPHISAMAQLRDETKGLARTPTYLHPNGVALDRQGEPYVAGLERQSWLLSSGAADVVKIGLITYDRTSFVAGAASIKRALGRRGHDLLTSYIKYPDSASDVSQSATHLQAAVLRFAQERVTRVMFLDIGGAATVYFMTLADSQRYRPRYGLSSQSVPASLRAAGAPAAQLAGAVGTGWIPLMDVGLEASKPAGAQACERLMVRGRQDMGTPHAKQVAMEACDRYGYFAAVTAQATKLTAAGLANAAEALRGWRSASTYAVAMTASRHDGAAAVRDFAFDTACDCFRGAGPIRQLP